MAVINTRNNERLTVLIACLTYIKIFFISHLGKNMDDFQNLYDT